MSSLEYACKRLYAFLDEIRALQESEFPYQHSKEALDRLEQLFRRKLRRLEQFNVQSDPDTVKVACALALQSVMDYLPLLGFILRSTNVRNAFEGYGPLLRLACAALEPNVARPNRKTRLLLSSEWDYSPFIYSEISDLPGFVLIGLPAPESDNPLLMPLAGHELGHSLWAQQGCERHFRLQITQEVVSTITSRWAEYQQVFPYPPIVASALTTNLAARETWVRAVEWTMRQAEESFCDFVGLRLFGISYLHAFAYLLSPNYSGSRSVNYPNMRRRVANQRAAGQVYGVNVWSGYEALFEDLAEPHLTDGGKFQLSVADEVLTRIVPDLIATVDQTLTAAGVSGPSDAEAQRIHERFRRVVPAENTRSLADILNAGWLASEDPKLWQGLAHVGQSQDLVLRELVLKNIEIFEIEQILKETP